MKLIAASLCVLLAAAAVAQEFDDTVSEDVREKRSPQWGGGWNNRDRGWNGRRPGSGHFGGGPQISSSAANANAASQTFNGGFGGGGFGGSASNANAGSSTFGGGRGGGGSSSIANAGSQTFNQGGGFGGGGFSGSASNANAASSTFNQGGGGGWRGEE